MMFGWLFFNITFKDKKDSSHVFMGLVTRKFKHINVKFKFLRIFMHDFVDMLSLKGIPTEPLIVLYSLDQSWVLILSMVPKCFCSMIFKP